ncbi:hypothetical protein A9Z42_0081210 [Trichoderma parareesei]|uniref:Uncharacterized protein n=1 Tax=Trichoderma parareesei TaxID=858221 RepID=A0A2H2ZZF2_TRIPA|nr:hypothetical protein A9Z42_0081210 [Trichoderma parareesei]
MSEMASSSQTGFNMQYLDRSAMLHSSYTQKTNPLFAGLITPPDTPIRSVDSSAPQSPTSSTLEASRDFRSTNNVQRAMEALSVAIRSASVESFGQDASVASSAAVSPSVALFDLENVREDIYSIVEHTVEAKMSDAMGPLRLHTDKLHREHSDIREQNDTLSRQIDLHYRTIEQNVEEFRSQSKTMNTLIRAQADQSKIMSTMIGAQADMLGHLSQLINNLPVAINQVVHNAVQQQTQLAIRDIMFSQQQAMFSGSDILLQVKSRLYTFIQEAVQI